MRIDALAPISSEHGLMLWRSMVLLEEMRSNSVVELHSFVVY